VLISGRGSNLQALLGAIERGQLDARVRLVISNRADAPGLEHARAAGIEALVIPHHTALSRDAYDRLLVEAIASRDVSFVCLAGFMRLLGTTFCDAFPNAVVNVHPSLLPAFPGTHAQRQALAHGVRVSGATVHFVTPELDAGPIIAQRAVDVHDDDSEESLSQRILTAEHRIYPEAVQRVLHTRWVVEGRRVCFIDHLAPPLNEGPQ
jgi:phosphoribosylglycinamide formyltransferase-1